MSWGCVWVGGWPKYVHHMWPGLGHADWPQVQYWAEACLAPPALSWNTLAVPTHQQFTVLCGRPAALNKGLMYLLGASQAWSAASHRQTQPSCLPSEDNNLGPGWRTCVYPSTFQYRCWDFLVEPAPRPLVPRGALLAPGGHPQPDAGGRGPHGPPSLGLRPALASY